MPRTVSLWRIRFAERGLAGLEGEPRPGGRASAKYDETTNRRILAVLERPPPAGYARWTGGLVAAELGDVSDQYVWRFLRAQKIDLDGTKSWCESHDPDFVAKSAEIIGHYLDPPEGALVLSVDEKPHIQALERAQGYLKLKGGRTLTGGYDAVDLFNRNLRLCESDLPLLRDVSPRHALGIIRPSLGQEKPQAHHHGDLA